MSNYTPDEATVKATWSEFLYMESHGMKHVDDSGEEFDRFIARVRADALREAAGVAMGHGRGGLIAADAIIRRARKIEEEA